MHTVIFRSGGTAYCYWSKTNERFETIEHANRFAESLEALGYKSLVKSVRELEALGLPVGWTPEHVDWELDRVEVHPDRTIHQQLRSKS